MIAPVKLLSIISICIFGFYIIPAKAENVKSENKTCGYSPIHSLKYNAASKHFSYVNSNAPKGGSISLGRVGAFDSLNFLKYPGNTIADRKQIPLNIADYLFDRFLVQSTDEVAGFYCLAASEISISKDYSKVNFTINQDVRFHDGKPLTVSDVIFTFETLKKQGHPYYRQVLRNVTIERISETSVRYISKRKGDKKFASLVGTLPLHPKHFWANGKLARKSMILPLGSGPYKIASVTSGKTAKLERVKSYWGRNHFTNKGRFNFDKIKINYFHDSGSALAAYKTGLYDIRLEKSAINWQQRYDGQSVSEGKIKKLTLNTAKPGEMYFLTFNQRRPIFKNRKVRKALALLYHFESTNNLLFHGLYSPVTSLYGKSELAAKGTISSAEKAMVAPFLKDLPTDFLTGDLKSILNVSSNSRKRIREAANLLDEAGLILKNGKRINPKTGKPIILEVAYLDRRHQRILLNYAEKLKTIGIQLSLPEREVFAARKKVLNHEFDLVVIKWSPSLLAGTSEALLWGSALADVKGSYALGGVKDPALDFAIKKLRDAKNWSDMVRAAKVFDRVFRWQIHALPLWGTNEIWVSYWDKYQGPEAKPVYDVTIVDRWWSKEIKQSSAY